MPTGPSHSHRGPTLGAGFALALVLSAAAQLLTALWTSQAIGSDTTALVEAMPLNPPTWGALAPSSWISSTPVTVSLLVTHLAGLEDSTPQFRYSIDAGSNMSEWSSENLSYTFNAGSTRAYITATNLALIDSAVSNTVEFVITDTSHNRYESPTYFPQVDTVPPVSNGLAEGVWNDGGWYDSAVTVTLQVTDVTSGPRETLCSVDQSSFLGYTDPIVITGDGPHMVRFYSVDWAGNREPAQAVTYSVKLKPPTWGPLAPSGWISSTPVTVSLLVTHLMGLQDSPPQFRYSVDAGNHLSDWTSEHVSYTLSAGFTRVQITVTNLALIDSGVSNTVQFAITDTNNNRHQSPSYLPKVDTVSPLTVALPEGEWNDGGWYDSAVTVTLQVADVTSGPRETLVSLDQSSSLIYTDPVVIAGDGAHTVRFYSVDWAGNREQAQVVTYTVKTVHTTFLPLVLRGYAPPVPPTPTPTSTPTPKPIQNPSFDNGLAGWLVTGTVAVTTTWSTSGTQSAFLGELGYGCAGGGVPGRHGVTQLLSVPTLGSSRLAFDYRIATQDSMPLAGDYLQMEINDAPVAQIGWTGAASGCLNPWNVLQGTFQYDLSAQRGLDAKLGIFVVIVDQYYNTVGYVDNVRWIP